MALNSSKRVDDMTRWLAAPDVSTNLNKALEARHEGSGRKLIEGEAYKTWSQQTASFLWLHGIPGSGKTILASTVIQDLEAKQNSSQTLLYHFFDFTDAQKQTFENAIRSLLMQLYLKMRRGIKNELDRLWESCKDGSEKPRMQSLKTTFVTMLKQAVEVWIVLDALDECPLRNDLLHWLQDLRRDQMNVHILVTSRPEQDIKSTIERICCDQEIMAIRDDLIGNDIRNYVHARIKEHEGLRRWQKRPAIQEEIEANLIDKANGMLVLLQSTILIQTDLCRFRWVTCQLDALEKCYDPRALRHTLASLPRTLDQTYARILAEIPPEHICYTRRILQFLTYSEQPLRLDEAVDAVAVDVDSRRFDPQDRMPIQAEITRYCSSLVILVRIKPRFGRAFEQLQLAHFSVKSYLISDRLEKETARYLREGTARSLIAEVCLVYLVEVEKLKSTIYCTDTENHKINFPFSEYSADNWASHAVIGERNSPAVLSLAVQIFLSHWTVKYCLQLQSRPWETPFRDPASGLYYAALLGLPRCVAGLLERGVKINGSGGRYGQPLHVALAHRHGHIVRLLIENGADVDAQGGFYGNALQVAIAERASKDLIHLLVEKGARISAQGGFYGNALQAAAAAGQTPVVQMLIEKGADIHALGGFYGNALQAAISEGGSSETIQMLLEKGASVDAPGGAHGDVLQAASAKGYKQIVHRLIARGADVNAQGEPHGNALQAASFEGHVEIVQLLIEEGAHVNARCGPYGNALQAAYFGKHRNIMQLLLEENADPSGIGRYGITPLKLAVFDGQSKVVELLLGMGADTGNNNEMTALYCATDRGELEIAKLLLRGGADGSVANVYGTSPLHCAAGRGDLEMVELLLQNGADIMSQDCVSRSVLFFSISSSSFELFSMILDQAPSLAHVRDHYGSTALSVASRFGQQAMVKVLAALPNADLALEDNFGRTALWWARTQRHHGIAALITEYLSISDNTIAAHHVPIGSTMIFSKRGVWCDVCMGQLEFPCYSCQICRGGDFHACSSCQQLGAHCLDGSHDMMFIR